MMASALIEREVSAPGRPLGPGVFVAVVGPSGAGKDTVIAYARDALRGDPAIVFVRRVVTRPRDAALEDHDSMAEAEFEAARAAGAFAVSWEAHGLKYGVPSDADAAIADGLVAVANLSRGAIGALRTRYTNVIVAEVTAAPEILAARLAARGRESGSEVSARLSRTQPPADAAGGDTVRIDNSGAREAAGERFVALLRKAVTMADISGVC